MTGLNAGGKVAVTEDRQRALIIAGPTCSGKAAMALALAQELDGVVINADSMQIYQDLHILTARPSPEDELAVDHRLYGVLPVSEAGNVAWWRSQALRVMEETWAKGRLPILCGGTGMYLRALTSGLSDLPDPGEEARQEARAFALEYGAEALHARLLAEDPETARTLRPSDTQRVTRAWEVWRGTGHGLIWWRTQASLPAAPCDFTAIRLNPARPALRQAITARFEMMLENGAIEEAKSLKEKNLPSELPAMRAHGVPELLSFLNNEISLETAKEKAVQATCRYTKRQTTWFAHQHLTDAHRTLLIDTENSIDAKFMERNIAHFLSFIENAIDERITQP